MRHRSTPTVRRRAVALGVSLAVLAVIGGCTRTGPTADTPTPTGSGAAAPATAFTSRVVTTDLANPWEVVWGPDGFLWVTEKSAGRVTRVAVTDGAKKTAVTIPDVLATEGGQDGLLGMALHPGLARASGDRFVYVAYTYDADPGAAGEDRRAKIARYTYDPAAQTLGSPNDLLTGLPASLDHNAGRLVFGPDAKLYYSIGDQGKNQFDEFCQPIEAQTLPTARQLKARDWTAYQGKILRINPDGSVPGDNPRLAGVRSHVYTYGHRNPQGLVFGPGDRLFASEQGPKTDDEVNRVQAGGNYGWPHVAGRADDKAYVYGNWSAARPESCESLSYSDFDLPESVPQRKESQFADPAAVEPLRTLYTVDSDHDFTDPRCGRDAAYICWPTIAPSSLDFVGPGCVSPGGGSLLMPALKDGAVHRMALSADGATVGEPTALFRTVNRYRDTAVNTEGSAVYVATDTRGRTRDLSGAPTSKLASRGALLEFRCGG